MTFNTQPFDMTKVHRIEPTHSRARVRSRLCHPYWPLVVAALLLSPVSQAQVVEVVRVDVMAVGKGYRVSQLIGKKVINDHNEDIGKIDDFIIGRDKVLFAVLQVGGFLGLNSRLVAVLYTSLDLEKQAGKIVLPGGSKEALQNLPEFTYRK